MRNSSRKTIRILLSLVLAIILSMIVSMPIVAQDGQNEQPTNESIGFLDKGVVFSAIENALAHDAVIKDDLIKRGLFTLPADDGKGTMIPGVIEVGKIESLIKEGTYSINKNNTLSFSSQSTPEPMAITTGSYKYAQMVTRYWELFDQFKYRGHIAYIDIPASITLNQDTVHIVYSTHLSLSNGKFVESGVGWVSWTSSPIIYTFQNYTGAWSYISVPAAARSIFCKIEIFSATSRAWMYVSDPYTGWTISTFQNVTSLNHRVDEVQEEYSNGAWTSTPQVFHHDNYIKNSSDQWVNWNNSINTDWDNDTPIYESHGIQNDRKWMRTWCTP